MGSSAKGKAEYTSYLFIHTKFFRYPNAPWKWDAKCRPGERLVLDFC
jgi:hypothetical protein